MMRRDHIILWTLAILLFVPFLGSVHLFDWDEINFAESAREMLLTGNWFQVQINFEPFWEKPPLFFWMQALAMQLFGVGEFAARLPNAIAGVVTLTLMFQIGRRWHGRLFGWTWVLLYIGSFLPHLYFRSGIIDPWFNLFIFLSIYHLFLVLEHGESKQTKNAILAGAFSGAAILTKGPVGLLLLILTLFAWLGYRRFKVSFPWKSAGWFALSAFLVSTLWFGYETIKNGPWFLQEFVSYQLDLLLHPVAGHKQPFFYHFAVVLLGCFPLSVFALPAFHRKFIGDDHRLSLWMKLLFWVVMILFSLVTTKIVHYSSMAYLPLAYLATLVITRAIEEQSILPLWQRVWVLTQGLVIALALIATPLAILWKDQWVGLIKDPFVVGNLSVEVPVDGWEWVIGFAFALLVILSFIRLRRSTLLGMRTLTLGTAFTIFSTMILIVPMIERISQHAAISFFEEHADEDVYFEPYGYKSYAHYFYGRISPSTAHQLNEHSLNTSDKPIMISVKVNRLERFQSAYPQAQFLYERGGYYFYSLGF